MPNIQQHILAYLNWRQKTNNVTADGMTRYKNYLKHFVNFLEGYKIYDIENITFVSLEEFQKFLSCEKTKFGISRKIGTQNDMLSMVNVFLRWLVKEGLLSSDLSINIKYKKNPDKLDGDISKNFPGGKGGVFQNLINLMPPHEVYIESHLGNGAVMRRKRSANHNVGIEIDPNVICMWNKEKQINFDLVHGDAITFLKGYEFSGKELVYCDPPYLRVTRKKYNALYKYEYTEEQHRELLNVIKTLKCKVIISGYKSSLYSEELQNWHSHSFQAATHSGLAIEYVWMNYPPPVELHDYSFLGKNFRERERISMKKKRWINRLNKMSSRDREVLLNALKWVWAGSPDNNTLIDYHSLGDEFRARERRNRKRQTWIKRLQTMSILEKQTLLDAISTSNIMDNGTIFSLCE